MVDVSAFRGRGGAVPTLLVALLVALATGAAASLLIGAATAHGSPPAPAGELVLPSVWFVYLVIGFLMTAVALFVYQRVSGGTVPVPSQAVVTFLVMVLVAVLLLVVFRAALGAGPTPSGAVSGGGNSTSPPSGNLTGSNNTTLPHGAGFTLPGLPGWLPFVLLAVVVLAMAALLVPTLIDRAAARRESHRPVARSQAEEVRSALAAAAAELDRGEDPRAVIVRLYGELLARLGPIVGSVEWATPEEIRHLHLERLGVRPDSARALTRLFEEARYSSHPLGPEALAKAQGAVGAALEDLERLLPAA